MADFVIGDVKLVRELNIESKVNLHLKDGWILLNVQSAPSRESDGVVTRYILGWLDEEEPKPEYKY